MTIPWQFCGNVDRDLGLGEKWVGPSPSPFPSPFPMVWPHPRRARCDAGESGSGAFGVRNLKSEIGEGGRIHHPAPGGCAGFHSPLLPRCLAKAIGHGDGNGDGNGMNGDGDGDGDGDGNGDGDGDGDGDEHGHGHGVGRRTVPHLC
jgi:hypothetical protein